MVKAELQLDQARFHWEFPDLISKFFRKKTEQVENTKFWNFRDIRSANLGSMIIVVITFVVAEDIDIGHVAVGSKVFWDIASKVE